MTPLDLGMLGSTVFSGVGNAVDSGKKHGHDGDFRTMHAKELLSGAVVGGVSMLVAWREHAIWPLALGVGLILFMICIHEWHANKAAPPEYSLTISAGSFK